MGWGPGSGAEDQKDFDSLLKEFMMHLQDPHLPPLDRTCDWGCHVEMLRRA